MKNPVIVRVSEDVILQDWHRLLEQIVLLDSVLHAGQFGLLAAIKLQLAVVPVVLSRPTNLWRLRKLPTSARSEFARSRLR